MASMHEFVPKDKTGPMGPAGPVGPQGPYGPGTGPMGPAGPVGPSDQRAAMTQGLTPAPPQFAPQPAQDQQQAPTSFGDSAVPSLASSPAYQAYLRELGMSEANLTNDEQFREAMLRRQLEPGSANLAQIGQQGDLARQHILGGMESRGILRSGETENAIALQRASEGAQRAALQGQINDQIAMLQHNLAQQLAGIAQKGTADTLSAAGGIFGQ